MYLYERLYGELPPPDSWAWKFYFEQRQVTVAKCLGWLAWLPDNVAYSHGLRFGKSPQQAVH